MWYIRAILISLLVFSSVSSWGAQVEENYTMSGMVMPELMLGIGTRVAGMGGAGAASVNDLSSLHWNPAGLRGINYSTVEFNHNSWLQETAQENFIVGIPVNQGFTLAASGTYFDLGTLESTGIRADGQIQLLKESLHPSAVGLNVGAALGILNNWQVGAGLKYFQENLTAITVQAVALDAGMQCQGPGDFAWGAALNNFGINGSGYQLPAGVRLGGAYTWQVLDNQTLMATGEGEMLLTSPQQVFYHVGAEYTLWEILAIRLGCQMSATDATQSFGITTGLGVHLGAWYFGYAFAPQGELGSSHRLSLGMAFLPQTVSSKKPKSRVRGTESPIPTNDLPLGMTRNSAENGSELNKHVVITREESAMRALMEKNLRVNAEIRETGRTREVIYSIQRASGARIVQWTFTVMSNSKKTVRVYQGEELPDRIIWNSRNEKGELMKHPEGTQYKLVLKDINDQTEVVQGRTSLGLDRFTGVGEEPEPHEQAVERMFGPILFEAQRSEITEDGAAIITSAAKYIRKHPGLKVHVEGYTDAVEEGAKALVLSKARVDAVVRYLTAYHRIPLPRLMKHNRGSSDPAASNDEPRQRFRNRRVIISVL